MPVQSAGLLLWRRTPAGVELLLGHPGGPFFARKDDGCWSVPKGQTEPGELLAAAARREFEEELGLPLPAGQPVSLGDVRLRGGKVVTVFAQEGDLDVAEMRSNPFDLEWPPRSGRIQQFPEIDRAAWFLVGVAREKLVKGQVPFLDRLLERLATG